MLNTIAIEGRMTADPKFTVTPSGVSYVNFTLACQRDFPDKSGNKEADFIPVVAWKQTAEFVQRHFTKGAKVIVTGRLQVRQYEKDGQKRTIAEIVAQNVYFGGDSKAPAKQDEPEYAPVTEPDAGLPF